MTRLRPTFLALIAGGFCCLTGSALAELVSDYAVQVSAVVQTNPAQITLSWPAEGSATGYTVYRKFRDDAAWGGSNSLTSNATSYVDSNVQVGNAYEYRVSKSAAAYRGEGYIYAGIRVPLVESRGKVVLVVDNTFTASLSNELARFQQDLVGDGWTVLRHNVPRMAVDPANTSSNVWLARSNELASVKALIMASYNADPLNVKAVLLLGHVPVAYSGALAPDAHSDHFGAWPADAFYGDMDGVWTDTYVTETRASGPRNWNLPGDGKFDQSSLPSDVELQVGRVDLANLASFSLSETELLRQYLNKDHRFRCKLTTAEARGLIDDNLGLSAGQPLAVNGWRNFAPFFGAANTFTSDLLTTLATQSYLWAYGCGAGSYTSISGIGATTDFVTKDPQVVFTMFFGSYLGDWDSPNNFLRAALGTTNFILTSVWGGRPNWEFHHMALGETIGFSTRASQNNDGITYSANGFQRYVHVALMGDPTLRMHIVAPPTNLVAVANGSGGVDLSWDVSPETVLGYHVYRATDPAGPYTRLNANLITGTSYTDSSSTATNYMVRALKLEVSGSGSYYNASQGIFQTVSLPSGLPVLTITAVSTNKVYGAPLPEFTVSYSGFTNGDNAGNLTTLPVLSTPATPGSPVGNYSITANGASSANYTIVYVPGTLSVTPATTTGALTSSVNPALPGQLVSFTQALSVVGPGAGTPTGNVQFKVDGSNAGAPGALSGGSASYSTSTLAHGLHTVVAEYAGDGNFIGITNSLASSQVINTPPVAGGDTIARDPTSGVKTAIVTLLSNDTDADSDVLNFLSASAASANGGTVVSNGGWLFYAPAVGFTNTDTFTYSINDGFGGPVVGTVTVNVRFDSGPSPNLTISNLGNGSFLVVGDGIPDRTYGIQFADDTNGTNWQPLGTATADPSGSFQYLDPSGSPQRFYRSVYP